MDLRNDDRRLRYMGEAIGQSEAFLETQEHISCIAPINRPVLVIGERGTGKELAAQRLHYLSNRWQEPFITLNCSSLSSSLLESELFGHEVGSFTGAIHQRKGCFERANGGTLFLDEIGTMPKQVQEKILRAIEYGEVTRVGGSELIRVDVRIVAATNVDLRASVASGEFRADLLDRLAFEVVTLPPLKDRGEDAILLARYFAAQMAIELGCYEPIEFSKYALQQLRSYRWPGNVRECKNVVERAVCQSKFSIIDSIVFDPFVSPYYPKPETSPETSYLAGNEMVPYQNPDTLLSQPLPEARKKIEVAYLRAALEKARFNQHDAARILGLSYHQFRGMYRKYNRDLVE